MLLRADRVLNGLQREFDRLRERLSDSEVEGSAAQAIANALQLLSNRERGESAAVQRQLDALDRLLNELQGMLESNTPCGVVSISQLRQSLGVVRSESKLVGLERAYQQLIADFQRVVQQINSEGLSRATKTTLMRRVAAWEAEDLAQQVAADESARPSDQPVSINHDNLTAYVQDRFQDPTLRLTSIQPLAGGFGKQTILFEVEGRALSGGFVMRRDIGDNASVPNDCHLTRQEYHVIKAAHARGFPAPDALWLDTEHRLLPGGDFIVMRRTPGRVGGNFFGARAAIPDDLADALADIMARLHTLPPLTELGALTDSIRPELWNMPMRDCIERYIRNWYELFLREEHTPSPSIVALYGWLLDNVPERSGRPVLLHGDIGFHNFLFDGGRLTGVLDWEFAHIGDPAEELGYVKVTVGSALDWTRLMARYEAAGGTPVDPQTLRYFQVWAFVRNATGANLLSTLFTNGRADDLKLTILPVQHIPQFIRGAQALIDAPF